MKKYLHVGAGNESAPEWLAGWERVRLDVNPDAQPDVCASMLDMGDIGEFDAVYASHVLEHVAPHEVPVALKEMRRVLKPDGVAIIFVPDLEGIEPRNEVAYECPAGEITYHDMFYGYAPYVKRNAWMAHRSGFVADTLREAMEEAGFSNVQTKRIEVLNLLGAGTK